MTLRIRHLDLTVETSAGPFGATITFGDGLSVVWADNTKGKSTCLQGIIYGLGLERMLSPRREIPLPHAMTAKLRDDHTGDEVNVLRSSVSLEIENSSGDVITIQRAVKGDTNIKLVSVWEGDQLTNPTVSAQKKDFFVLDPGAATREAGFHSMLVDFLGWQPPVLPRYDGGEAPLYLEAIFPLVYVEQKVGWGAIPANFPTYLGIRDMGRRAVEFVLGLGVHQKELERQRLDIRMRELKQQWTDLCDEAERIAELVDGRVDNIPKHPSPGDGRPLISVLVGENWIDLERAVTADRQHLAQLESRDIPTADAAAESLERELQAAMETLSERSAARQELFRVLRQERTQEHATKRRLTAIGEDLQKHKDTRKLAELGSEVASALATNVCPTCQQDINDALLPPDAIGDLMSVDDNIGYLESQRRIFQGLLARSQELIRNRYKNLVGVRAQISELQARIRSLKATLTAPADAPSIAALQERVSLQELIRSREKVMEPFSALLRRLNDVLKSFEEARADLATLPTDSLGTTGRDRIDMFASLLVEQLHSYGFSTFSPESVAISRESYRPMREGFEIGFESSASDTIRMKWAYQLALLETALRSGATGHPGLVVFDEPRQQETAKVSFAELLKHAAEVGAKGAQVIFATSEEKSELEPLIAGLPCKLIAFEGHVISRRR